MEIDVVDRFLSGKVVFVIGVGCGIGWEIVLCFVCDGVDLVVYYSGSEVGVVEIVCFV